MARGTCSDCWTVPGIHQIFEMVEELTMANKTGKRKLAVQPKTKKCACGSWVNASSYFVHIRDCPVVLKERAGRKQMPGGVQDNETETQT